MRFWIFLLFVSLIQVAVGQDESSAFAKANSSYTAENYQEAIDSYESILQSGQHSAELYYNLGNSYYKMNQVGPAIYNYEKALQMEPSNDDFQNNLKFAQQLRVDSVEEVQSNPFNEFVTGIFTSLSVDNWAYLSIILALLTVLFFILYHYAATAGKKRLMFVISMIFLLATIFAIVAASYSQQLMDDNQQAIVYSAETITKSEPRASAESSFSIHEGTKVTILEEYENWAKIKVANGSESWMPLSDLKKL